MTTAVIVKPAGHRIEIVQTNILQDGTRQDDRPRVIEPDVEQVTVYVHSTMEITVRELPPE